MAPWPAPHTRPTPRPHASRRAPADAATRNAPSQPRNDGRAKLRSRARSCRHAHLTSDGWQRDDGAPHVSPERRLPSAAADVRRQRDHGAPHVGPARLHPHLRFVRRRRPSVPSMRSTCTRTRTHSVTRLSTCTPQPPPHDAHGKCPEFGESWLGRVCVIYFDLFL